MKPVVIILALALAALGVVFYTQHRSATEQLATAQTKLDETRTKLMNAELATATAKSELAKLAQQVQTLTTEKNQFAEQVQQAQLAQRQAQDQVQTLQKSLEQAQNSLAEEKSRIAVVDDEKTRLTTQYAAVNDQLKTLRGQLTQMERTNSANVRELNALRERVAALEMEKTSLEARMNDIAALRDQIRYLKRQEWENHVADWKKRGEALSTSGNQGFLKRDGQWFSETSPAQTPAK